MTMQQLLIASRHMPDESLPDEPVLPQLPAMLDTLDRVNEKCVIQIDNLRANARALIVETGVRNFNELASSITALTGIWEDGLEISSTTLNVFRDALRLELAGIVPANFFEHSPQKFVYGAIKPEVKDSNESKDS